MNEITVLRILGNFKATKTIFQGEDRLPKYAPFPNAKTYEMSFIYASNIEELANELSALNDKQLVIRGAPIHGVDESRYVQRVKFNPRLSDSKTPNQHPFIDQPSNWVMFDFDKEPLPEGFDLKTDPEDAITYLIQRLPQEFQECTCFWRLSSSAGLAYLHSPPEPARSVSGHLWFWLKDPQTSDALNAFAMVYNQLSDTKLIDNAMFNPVQGHLVTDPIFRDPYTDPLSIRAGLIRGTSEEVDIDISSYINEWKVQNETLPTSIRSSIGNTRLDNLGIGYEGYLSSLGDQEDGNGFNAPLTAAIMSCVGTHKIYEGHPEILALKSDLRSRIAQAVKGPERESSSIDKYTSDNWLDNNISGAIKLAGNGMPSNYIILDNAKLSSEEAVNVLNQTIKDFTDTVFYYNREIHSGDHPSSVPTLALKAAAGIGKTTAIIEQCINSGAFSGSIDYYVPSHNLAEDVAKKLREELTINTDPAPPFSTVRVIRGRDLNDDDGNSLCTNLTKVNKAISLGLSIQRHICAECANLNDCGYQKQFTPIALPQLPEPWHSLDLDVEDFMCPPPVINVMAHNYLFLPSQMYPSNQNKPSRFNQTASNLAIVDEKFWDKGILQVYLPANVLINQKRPIPIFIFTRLTGHQPLISSMREVGFTKADLLAEANHVSPKPSDLNSSDQHTYSANLAILYRVLADELEINIDTNSRCVSLQQNEDGSQVVQVLQRNKLRIPSDVPMIFIDADLSLPILKLYRDSVDLVEIALERQAEVYQVEDFVFSRRHLLQQENLDQVRTFIEQISQTGRTLVVAMKEIRRKLTGESEGKLPTSHMLGQAEIAHFSYLRGLNDFADYENVIILGRQQANTESIEQQAKALWWDDSQQIDEVPLIDGHKILPNQNRVIRLRNSKYKEVVAQCHPDWRAQIVNEQSREVESTQAIDRLRLVRNRQDRREAKIFLLSNLPLDITVDHLFSWEWYLFSKEVVDLCTGLIPLNKNDLAKVTKNQIAVRTADRRIQYLRDNIELLKDLGLLKGYSEIRYRRAGSSTKFSTALYNQEYGSINELFYDSLEAEIEINNS